MSLGVEVISRSEEYAVMCNGQLLTDTDIVLPLTVISLVYPGGAPFGSIMISDSKNNPGEYLVVMPYDQNGKQKRNEIVNLGTVRRIEAFSNLAVRCVNYIPD